MGEGRIHFTRDELYSMVWSEPIQRLAKKFGVSDVWIAKICKKLNIPRPGRGYWRRKERGYKAEQLPLPPLKDPRNQEAFLTQHKPVSRKSPEKEKEEELLHENVRFEKANENLITVPATLRNPHPYIATTIHTFEDIRPDQTGILKIGAREALDIQASPKNLKRALRIMNALLKAFERRGYIIHLKKKDYYWSTFVTVLDEDLEFGLVEYRKQKKTALTSDEKKERERYFYPSSSFHYDYYPSNNLALVMKAYVNDTRKIWSDGKKQRLENLLNSFIIGLVRGALKMKEERIEREKRERERQELMRLREEQMRLREEERTRIQQLESEVANWHKSKQIRSYVEAVREFFIQRDGGITPGGKIDQWLLWADQQADRFDPLVDSPPSILDKAS